jgi:hypothetical protein
LEEGGWNESGVYSGAGPMELETYNVSEEKAGRLLFFKRGGDETNVLIFLNEERAAQNNMCHWTWQVSESFFKDAFIMTE